MTQDQYTLWTGVTVDFDDETWNSIVAVASMRLASFLCLAELPTDDEGILEDGLQMLLANFICATLRYQGNPESEITSKRIRNFTISFSSKSAANAFAQVGQNYGDLIEKYSDCGTGVSVERATRFECDRHHHYGGCHGCI